MTPRLESATGVLEGSNATSRLCCHPRLYSVLQKDEIKAINLLHMVFTTKCERPFVHVRIGTFGREITQPRFLI